MAFQKLERFLPKGRFGRHVLMLAGSTTLGQAIGVLLSPVLTRLYTPADFGVWAIFTSVLSVLLVVSSFRYEMAIPLPAEEEKGAGLFLLGLVCVGVTTAVASALMWVFGPTVLGWMHAEALLPYWWLLPVCLLGGGAFQVLNYWAVRHTEYGAISRAKVLQSASQALVQCAAGLTPGGAGLLLGEAVGRLMGMGGLMASALKKLQGGAKPGALWALAKEYSRFPQVMTWASLFNVLAVQAPFFLIPAYFGTAAAGSFFLAQRIMVLPIALIGGAVGQVFFGRAAKLTDQPEALSRMAKRLVVALLAINLPLYGVVAIVGQPAFTLIFGAAWGEAGQFAQLLAPMVLFWALANPIGSLLVVDNRLGESLTFAAVELVTKVAAIAIGIYTHSLLHVVGALSVLGLGLYVLALVRFLRVAHLGLGDFAAPAGRVFLYSLPVWGMAGVFTYWQAWGALVVLPAVVWSVRGLVREVRRDG